MDTVVVARQSQAIPQVGHIAFDWMPYYMEKYQKSQRNLQTFWESLRDGHYGVSVDQQVLEAIRLSAIAGGGKRVRAVLAYLAHDLAGGQFSQIDQLSLLAELPHRGSLIEDDMDDQAEQRDGKLPAHLEHGAEVASEAAQVLYQSPRLILETDGIDGMLAAKLLTHYKRLSVEARLGQTLDLAWSQASYVPSTEEYLRMCKLKCAAFEFAILVGALAGGADSRELEVLVQAGHLSATAFQLHDDMLCLRSGADDYGADIVEGKKTLPVIHAVGARSPGSQRLLEILASKTKDPIHHAEAIAIMEESGSLHYTQATAQRLAVEAKSMLTDAFPESAMRNVLLGILDFGIQRDV